MRCVEHGRHAPFVLKLKDVPGFTNLLGQPKDDEEAKKFEKLSNYELHLCGCGLSKNKPFCDGHHAKTLKEEEGRVYLYNENGDVITTLDKIIGSDGKEISLPDEYK